MAEAPTAPLNDGRSIPQFGLGVWRTAADEARSVVSGAVDAGYRSVDTATIYGNEEGVGEALRDRPDVFLTTKLWNSDQGYDAALAGFDASLKRLGRDSVDLYLIHWPAPAKGLYVETWRALVRLKKEGRALSIGVSNFEPEHLEAILDATGVAPVLNQVELHPDFQQRELRAFHDAHDIRTESWSPLGQGRILENPAIAAVATKHGKTVAQTIIRWHLDSGLVVIPKSSNPGRIAENIDVFDFALDAEDMAAFDRLDDPGARIGPHPNKADF